MQRLLNQVPINNIISLPGVRHVCCYYCDETEPRCPLRDPTVCGTSQRHGTLIKTSFYFESHNPFEPKCSRHISRSHPISRSTDLYLQIYRSLSLHCLTLTLTVGTPHLHSKKFATRSSGPATHTNPKVAYNNQQHPAYIALTHYYNIPTTK